MMTPGERLKQQRGKAGYKQDDFAKLAGVSTPTQSRYENDERFPDLPYFQKIGDIVDFNYVVFGVSTPAAVLPESPKGHSVIKISRDVKASAGLGLSNINEQWDKLVIPDSWLWQIAQVRPSDTFRIIAVDGYSMHPLYKDGDLVLIDTSVRAFAGTGTYIFKKTEDDVYIKTLRKMMDGTISIISENDDYESYNINSESDISLEILAQVVCEWKFKPREH